MNFKAFKISKFVKLGASGRSTYTYSWVIGLLQIVLLLTELYGDFFSEGDLLAFILGLGFAMLSGLAVDISSQVNSQKEVESESIARSKKFAKPFILKTLITLVSVGLIFQFNTHKISFWHEEEWFQWWSVWLISISLLVLVQFKQAKGETEIFQKTISLIQNLSLALFLSVVLAGGMSLTLATIEHLFDVDVPGKIYSTIWIILGLGLCFDFYLGLVAESFHENGPDEAGLPVKSQWVGNTLDKFGRWMLPYLLITYLLVLLAYGLKMLLEKSLPKGMLGAMTLGYGCVLIFTWIASRANHREPKFKTIFWLTTPLVYLMLIVAASRRISEYGLTEERFILIWLGSVVFIVSFIQKFSARSGLWNLTFGICLGAFLIFLGPFGISALVKTQHYEKLNQKLVEAEMFESGQLIPLKNEISDTLAYDIREGFDFLLDRYGMNSLEGILSEAMMDSLKTRSPYGQVTWLLEELDVPVINRWDLKDPIRSRVQDRIFWSTYKPKYFKIKGEWSCLNIGGFNHFNTSRKEKPLAWAVDHLEAQNHAWFDSLGIKDMSPKRESPFELHGEEDSKQFFSHIYNLNYSIIKKTKEIKIEGIEGTFCIQ